MAKKGIVKDSIADKFDGEVRLCADYHVSNKKIVRDRYPISLIEDLLVELQDAVVFSTLNFKDGFLQIKIEEESTTLRRYSSVI